MNRICSKCGTVFEGDKHSYLCRDCAAAARSANIVRARTCIQCGKSFPGGPRARYCPDCRSERIRVADARYKRDGYARKIGSTDLCEICGAEYTVSGGRQRYCPACAPEAVRAVDRPASVEWYGEHKDSVNERRRTMRKMCGTPRLCDDTEKSKT